MKVSITVEINETDNFFKNFVNTKKISIDIAFNKYKFDILKDSQNKRLDYMAVEASLNNEDVLIGNVAYNLEEVLYFNNVLKKFNLSLSTVYVPSDERIEDRRRKAIEDQKNWGYREGVSEDEIERNFKKFRFTIQEIIDYLKNSSIEIKAI